LHNAEVHSVDKLVGFDAVWSVVSPLFDGWSIGNLSFFQVWSTWLS